MIPQNLLPTPWNNSLYWCVAGGWAACPSLASDCDVWVLVDPADLDAVRADIVAHCKAVFPYFEEQEDGRKQLVDIFSIDEERYILTGVNIRKVGKHGKFHIMVTDAPDIEALLNSFDVSTHAVAVRPDGTVVKGENWTPITVIPRKVHDTPTTKARLAKIAKRYGHPTAQEDI